MPELCAAKLGGALMPRTRGCVRGAWIMHCGRRFAREEARVPARARRTERAQHQTGHTQVPDKPSGRRMRDVIPERVVTIGAPGDIRGGTGGGLHAGVGQILRPAAQCLLRCWPLSSRGMHQIHCGMLLGGLSHSGLRVHGVRPYYQPDAPIKARRGNRLTREHVRCWRNARARPSLRTATGASWLGPGRARCPQRSHAKNRSRRTKCLFSICYR